MKEPKARDPIWYLKAEYNARLNRHLFFIKEFLNIFDFLFF